MLIGKLTAQFGGVFAAATPSVIVSRPDANSMHSNSPAPESPRNKGIDLPLPLERPPRVEESAICLVRERHELKFAFIFPNRNLQLRYEFCRSLTGILRAHVLESAPDTATNPEPIWECFEAVGAQCSLQEECRQLCQVYGKCYRHQRISHAPSFLTPISTLTKFREMFSNRPVPEENWRSKRQKLRLLFS
jgi:hypothetical protein